MGVITEHLVAEEEVMEVMVADMGATTTTQVEGADRTRVTGGRDHIWCVVCVDVTAVITFIIALIFSIEDRTS